MHSLTYTGTQVNYFLICGRKLWLFSHYIQMEHNSDYVAIGKMIGEESYNRKKKEIEIDGKIKIDIWDKKGVIHEVKKTDKMEESHIWQLKYYLFYMKQKGALLKGEIDYPKLKKKEKVTLSDEDCRKLENMFREIENIIQKNSPPDIINSKICKKCSYYEFCYV